MAMIDFVNEFALGIIAFSIGSEFKLTDHKKSGKDVFIIILVNENQTLERAIRAVEEVLGHMKKPGVGLMFSVDVGNVVGL